MRIWLVRQFIRSSFDKYEKDSFESAENMLAALKFFFEECHLNLDQPTLKETLKLCVHLDNLKTIFRNSRNLHRNLSIEERMRIFAKTLQGPDTVGLFIAMIGLPIPELALFQHPEVGSALHQVTRQLARPFNSYVEREEIEREKIEEWTQVGIDIIQYGADLFLVKYDGDGPMTPLLQLLDFWWEPGTDFHHISQPLERWNTMLDRANVDLEWYYAKEYKIWKSLGVNCEFHRKFSDTSSVTKRLVKIEFCSETQTCFPIFRHETTIPVMALQSLPGSFCEIRNPVKAICWGNGTPEEEDEGHRSLVKEVVIRGSLTYDNVSEPLYRGPHDDFVDSAQDDNGPLLRMTRLPGDNNCSGKRAWSQPPMQRQRRESRDRYLVSSLTHVWLPADHYCFVQSRWTLSCHHVRQIVQQGERSYSALFIEPRLCAHQADRPSHCSNLMKHNGYRSGGNTFLSEIRDCQMFPFDQNLAPSPDSAQPLSLRHNNSARCPQGCGTVDLEKLNEPNSMPHWHPGKGAVKMGRKLKEWNSQRTAPS